MKTLKTLIAALAVVVCGSVNAYQVEFNILEDKSFETLNAINQFALGNNISLSSGKYLLRKHDGSMIMFEGTFDYQKNVCSGNYHNAYIVNVKKFSNNNTFEVKSIFGGKEFAFKTKVNPHYLNALKPHSPLHLSLEEGTLVEDIQQSKL
jgi:hypothetical protein